MTQQGYETTDAEPRPLVWFLVGLTALILVSAVVTVSLEDNWNEEVDARTEPHPMRAFRTEPQGPLLQATTSTDLIDHRAEEDRELRKYGWVDAESGIVQIPVGRAMEVLVERGLPAREGGS